MFDDKMALHFLSFFNMEYAQSGQGRGKVQGGGVFS